MSVHLLRRLRAVALVLLAFAGLHPDTANALPSFARQTGMDCAACHVGAFGPQLTPKGIDFKMSGYSDTGGEGRSLPLSAMVLGTYTHTASALGEDPGPNDGRNNNLSLQEVSAFIAGRLFEHAGSFTQLTYSDIDKKMVLDALELRYAAPVKVADKDALLGVTVNNNPSQTDPFNTLPGWRAPFTGSELSNGPVASPLLDGGLEHQVLGSSVYTYWNHLYAELGGYRSLSASTLRKINVKDEAGKISGLAPYARLAWYKDMRTQAFSVGVFGFSADLHPERSSGRTDKYDDYGVDASYQYLGNRRNEFTVNGAYMHEHRRLDGSFDAGGASARRGSLGRFDLTASYYYANTWGLSAGVFDVRGSRDQALYGGESRLNDPDSNGMVLQADWTPFGKESSWGSPWANVRVGLQYTAYNKFNGARHDYDGNGADATDNNTLFAFIWSSF